MCGDRADGEQEDGGGKGLSDWLRKCRDASGQDFLGVGRLHPLVSLQYIIIECDVVEVGRNEEVH